METTNNTKKRKNGKFGLTLAALVLLSIFLLRLPASPIAGAQPPGDQPRTRFAITDLGRLATSFSEDPTINQAVTGEFARDDEPARINFVQGKIAFEFVGQAKSFPPTASAPLGSANQYGFLTVVRGIDNAHLRPGWHDHDLSEHCDRELREPRLVPVGHPHSNFDITPTSSEYGGGYIHGHVRKHHLVDERLHH